LFATTTVLKTFGGGEHKLIIGGNVENSPAWWQIGVFDGHLILIALSIVFIRSVLEE